MRRVHLRIDGFVQGVNFRYYTRQRAASLGLAGWVRNCPDGSVEIVAQGDAESVEALVNWARHGPSMARVDRFEIEEQDPDPHLTTFSVRG